MTLDRKDALAKPGHRSDGVRWEKDPAGLRQGWPAGFPCARVLPGPNHPPGKGFRHSCRAGDTRNECDRLVPAKGRQALIALSSYFNITRKTRSSNGCGRVLSKTGRRDCFIALVGQASLPVRGGFWPDRLVLRSELLRRVVSVATTQSRKCLAHRFETGSKGKRRRRCAHSSDTHRQRARCDRSRQGRTAIARGHSTHRADCASRRGTEARRERRPFRKSR